MYVPCIETSKIIKKEKKASALFQSNKKESQMQSLTSRASHVKATASKM